MSSLLVNFTLQSANKASIITSSFFNLFLIHVFHILFFFIGPQSCWSGDWSRFTSIMRNQPIYPAIYSFRANIVLFLYNYRWIMKREAGWLYSLLKTRRVVGEFSMKKPVMGFCMRFWLGVDRARKIARFSIRSTFNIVLIFHSIASLWHILCLALLRRVSFNFSVRLNSKSVFETMKNIVDAMERSVHLEIT